MDKPSFQKNPVIESISENKLANKTNELFGYQLWCYRWFSSDIFNCLYANGNVIYEDTSHFAVVKDMCLPLNYKWALHSNSQAVQEF